jgi:hypothetical protein
MRRTDLRRNGVHVSLNAAAIVFAAILAALLVLPACSVNVKKEGNGQDKQVDIKTLLGGIHVSNDVDASDTGLAVYPGSHVKAKDPSGDQKNANVNISGFGYGIKVVALEYESDDAPAKILSFYKDQMKKYGNVLECHTSGLNLNMKVGHVNVETKLGTYESENNSNELTCEGEHGNNIELKVGRKDDQHIVAVEPQGKGSSFSLVYVRTHGKDADI